MNKLPSDIKFEILKFSENKNMIYLNKTFYKYILSLRTIFYKKIVNEPLDIKYQLIRWKEKFSENRRYRPSMVFEEEQIFKLSKDNLGIKIGKLEKDKIIFTKDFEDLIIPLSYMKENNHYQYSGTVIYWTINKVYPDNPKMYIYYYLIN